MTLNIFWDCFTYMCRIFKKDRIPDYIKVEGDDDEIAYGKLSDFDTPPYTFVIIRN